MALISQETLLGKLIPDVYINGITLETSGEPLIVDDPHIQDERENAEYYNISSRTEKSNMSITVDVSLKEILDNDMIGNWFREQNFQKYLKINVFKITSPILVKYFSQNQNTIQLLTEGLNTSGSISSTAAETKQMLEFVNGEGLYFKDLSDIGKYFKKHIEKRVLSVFHDTLAFGASASEAPTTTDADGNTIRDYVYRVVFQDDKDIETLGLFVASHLDLGQMKQDYDLEFNVQRLDEQNGKVSSEYVIRDGNIVSESYVYVISGNAKEEEIGKIWTGPIHKIGPSKYAAGSQPSADAPMLRKELIPNNKIQDFRQIDEVRKYDLSKYIKQMRDYGHKSLALFGNQRLIPNRKTTSFSDIWICRDSFGAARFMFGFDFVSFLKENSAFGYTLEEGDAKTIGEVVSSCRVKHLKIKRRRVRKDRTSNYLGTPVTSEVLFDKSTPYTSLVMTGSNNNNTLVTASSEKATVRESELVTDSSPVGMKYYTVYDEQMKNITDGLYQYGVEIEVEDGAVIYIKSLLGNLTSNKRILEEYLLQSMKTGMTKKILEINDPHIDDRRERLAYSYNTMGHYDTLTNRFTKKFVDFSLKRYNASNYPWIYGALEYAKALQFLTKEDISKDLAKIVYYMAGLANPESGTPKGIMSVISLYDDLISKIHSLLGIETENENVNIQSLSTEYWFSDNPFDSNIPKNMGMDYLSNTYSNTSEFDINKSLIKRKMHFDEYSEIAYGNRQRDGLKIVDGGYWTSRIDAEILKYFTDKKPDLSIQYDGIQYLGNTSVSNTSFGFLSPSYVVTNSRAYYVDLSESDDYFAEIESGLFVGNKKTFPYIENDRLETNQTSSEKIHQSIYQSIFSDYNVTVDSAIFREGRLGLLSDNVLGIDVSTDFCQELQFDAVDPHPFLDENTGKTSDSDLKSGDIKNSNFSDFFKKIQDNITKYAKAGDLKKIPQEFRIGSIYQYDVSNPDSFINNILKDGGVKKSTQKSIGFDDVKMSSYDVVSYLPNQIKSLIMVKTSPALVKYDWASLNLDPIFHWKHSSKFVVNYEFLTSVERFAGFKYERLDKNKPSSHIPAIKKEIWVPLTEEYYFASRGKELLCRLKPFSLSASGLKLRATLRTNLYDKYFLIKPPEEATLSISPFLSSLVTVKDKLIADLEKYAQLNISQFATTNLIIGK